MESQTNTYNYRYKPNDYTMVLNLPTDLAALYHALDAYTEMPTTEMKWILHERSETVFFSIKHREIEGILSPIDAAELRDYLGEVVNDRLQHC